MNRWIVDASVAVKWFLTEENSAKARQLLLPGNELWAPDLLWPEVGNAIWKRVRRGELEMEEADEIVRLIGQSHVDTWSSSELLGSAFRVAVDLDLSVYDSLYIALSIAKGVPLVTADTRLRDAFEGGTDEPQVVWVGDVL